MRMFSRAGRIIKTNSKYLFLGLAIFIVGALLGFMNAEAIRNMAQELLQELERIANKIGDNGTPIYTFWVIFKNNVVASLTMIGLGVFFGIFPIFALLSNAILLGFMLKTMSISGANPLSVLLLGIMPHGIVEISAVIFAAAIGIKYGMLVLRMIVSMAHSEARSRVADEFKESLHDLPFIVVMIIVMLFVAAIIESTVTPYLIHTFIGAMGNIHA